MNNRSTDPGRSLIWQRLFLLASLMAAVAAVTPMAATEASAEDRRFGPITPEHTLWRIASENLPDESVTIYQYMLALVDANPHAFIAGNASLMRSGQMLTLPSAESARIVPAEEARQRLQQQNEWVASLSPQELRAVRLGEVSMDRQPLEATPAPPPVSPPEPDSASEPDSANEPVGMIESAPTLESESESESEWLAAPDEPAADAEPDMPAPTPAEADALFDPAAEVETEAEPRFRPQPSVEPEANAPPVVVRSIQSDRSESLPMTWLFGLMGLVVVLAGLGLMFWRRRRSAAVEISQAPDLQTTEVAASAATDSESMAVATKAPATESKNRPRAGDASPEPDQVQPPPPASVSRSAADTKPSPSPESPDLAGAAPEDNDSWDELEASVLQPPPSSARIETVEEMPSNDPEPAAEPEPAAGTDEGFDFGELGHDPVDELVLSSELNPEAEADINAAPDGLDLDFNFSSQDTGGTPETDKPEADSGFGLEDESEPEPGTDKGRSQAADLSLLEAELEAALAPEPPSRAEVKAPESGDRMSDSEAEISLDLAGILASTDDSEYARELLDEVIAKGSEQMAARAQEIRDSLS